jgi:16S rRNA (guanine(966)-N(2))-methyltransferase RsmD
MRIIRGNWKSRRINPPSNLPVRPTTDIAKEALFNVLENILDFEILDVLDLFAGTGNISYEFASRGVRTITAVELNFKCVQFIRITAQNLNIQQLTCIRSDAFRFLKTVKHHYGLGSQSLPHQYHLIFADPPYDLPQLETIPDLIFQHNLLHVNGLLILEHPNNYNFSTHKHFSQNREYGKMGFTFFKNGKEEKLNNE